MTKYLIIADVSQHPYSTENILFEIFSTKEEAVKWIIDNPKITKNVDLYL